MKVLTQKNAKKVAGAGGYNGPKPRTPSAMETVSETRPGDSIIDPIDEIDPRRPVRNRRK